MLRTVLAPGENEAMDEGIVAYLYSIRGARCQHDPVCKGRRESVIFHATIEFNLHVKHHATSTATSTGQSHLDQRSS